MFTTHKFDQFMRLYKQLIYMDADMQRTLRTQYDDEAGQDAQITARVKSDALAERIAETEAQIQDETGIFAKDIRLIGAAIEVLMYNPGEDE